MRLSELHFKERGPEFLDLLGKFCIMLSEGTLNVASGWMQRARLWRLIFLQARRHALLSRCALVCAALGRGRGGGSVPCAARVQADDGSWDPTHSLAFALLAVPAAQMKHPSKGAAANCVRALVDRIGDMVRPERNPRGYTAVFGL